MERWVITWVKDELRYAVLVGYKHTAEIRSQKLKDKGYEQVEFFNKKQFNLKYGNEIIHSPS